MESKYILGFLIILVVLLANGLLRYISRASDEKSWKPLISDEGSFTKALEEIRARHDQPALAAALIHGDTITQGVVGSCLYGVEQPVNGDSRFHIGSTTKSMTSLLIGILVNEGKLRYDMTLPEALPRVAMLDAYRAVTLHDLLLNKAGIIALQQIDQEDPGIVKRIWEEIPARYSDPKEQRREVTKIALNLDPIAMPGSQAIYSNVGWAIAGHVAELAANQSFEALVTERIFTPLGMRSSRFGRWPSSNENPDQPRGHYPPKETEQHPAAQKLNDEYVFPDWMNPSGGVHCTIADFALYARENLRGLQGKGKLVLGDFYRTIHSIHATEDIRKMYHAQTVEGAITLGYGWAVIPVEGSHLSAADGSGGTFFARILIYPALDLAFVGFTNCGNGSRALDETIERLTGFEWNS